MADVKNERPREVPLSDAAIAVTKTNPCFLLLTPTSSILNYPQGRAEGGMNNTPRVVSDLNVARFVDRLRLESDRVMRTSLQRLLLKELESLVFNCEQLGNVQR